MNMLAIFCYLFLNLESSLAEQWRREATVESHEHLYNPSNNKTRIKVSSVTECSHKCFYAGNSCVGVNFHIEKIKGRHSCELAYHDEGKEKFLEKIGWIYLKRIEKKKKILQETPVADSPRNALGCRLIKESNSSVPNGVYSLTVGSETIEAYCDMLNGGFTLIARFSNVDARNWMEASGNFWYQIESYGNDTSTSSNADMVSKAFSKIAGYDLKLTRSDDNGHVALMSATGCMGGQSLRTKVASYGDFRNCKVWTKSYRCLGSCSATFGGLYSTTKGFKYATSSCKNSGDILDGGYIGFWCRYGSGDGAVVMIGGGGASCNRADHGIGLTEENSPRLGTSGAVTADFGDDSTAGHTASAYALNLWIR